ncbi:helix-turn-helix transcriptional regulator [Citrobacter amalonaticus]|uniref:helix-turn-helix transcriptional regulator n=1 Tax=Citrobacter amalonaticus TaxID=35703 RepID=UPI00339C2F48
MVKRIRLIKGALAITLISDDFITFDAMRCICTDSNQQTEKMIERRHNILILIVSGIVPSSAMYSELKHVLYDRIIIFSSEFNKRLLSGIGLLTPHFAGLNVSVQKTCFLFENVLKLRTPKLRHVQLTPMEHTIFDLLKRNLTIREIADISLVKTKTVYIHIDKIKKKYAVNTIAELILKVSLSSSS